MDFLLPVNYNIYRLEESFVKRNYLFEMFSITSKWRFDKAASLLLFYVMLVLILPKRKNFFFYSITFFCIDVIILCLMVGFRQQGQLKP